MTTDHQAPQPTIRDDVMAIFAAAGFEVRDTVHQFAVTGTIDSAAILVEMLLTGELPEGGDHEH
jgi:hypothetical protein